MATIIFNFTIPFGTSLRVGYIPTGSAGPYTYITDYPTYSDSPYTLTVPSPGQYNLELTTICPNCSGSQYSSPLVITVVNAT